MTLLHISNYEPVVVYYLRCRTCRQDFESFDREDPCRYCSGPTEVYGLQERLLRKLPQTA